MVCPDRQHTQELEANDAKDGFAEVFDLRDLLWCERNSLASKLVCLSDLNFLDRSCRVLCLEGGRADSELRPFSAHINIAASGRLLALDDYVTFD